MNPPNKKKSIREQRNFHGLDSESDSDESEQVSESVNSPSIDRVDSEDLTRRQPMQLMSGGGDSAPYSGVSEVVAAKSRLEDSSGGIQHDNAIQEDLGIDSGNSENLVISNWESLPDAKNGVVSSKTNDLIRYQKLVISGRQLLCTAGPERLRVRQTRISSTWSISRVEI